MPGTVRSMHLEHVLRDVQTDRGSLRHGRLLWVAVSTPSPWHTDAVGGRPLHHPLLPMYAREETDRNRPRLCENSNDRAPVYKFQSIVGPFPVITSSAERKSSLLMRRFQT